MSVPDWKRRQQEDEQRKQANLLAEEQAKKNKIAAMGFNNTPPNLPPSNYTSTPAPPSLPPRQQQIPPPLPPNNNQNLPPLPPASTSNIRNYFSSMPTFFSTPPATPPLPNSNGPSSLPPIPPQNPSTALVSSPQAPPSTASWFWDGIGLGTTSPPPETQNDVTVSGPIGPVQHKSHMGFNKKTGKFEAHGLPQEWQDLLSALDAKLRSEGQRGITKKEVGFIVSKLGAFEKIQSAAAKKQVPPPLPPSQPPTLHSHQHQLPQPPLNHNQQPSRVSNLAEKFQQQSQPASPRQTPPFSPQPNHVVGSFSESQKIKRLEYELNGLQQDKAKLLNEIGTLRSSDTRMRHLQAEIESTQRRLESEQQARLFAEKRYRELQNERSARPMSYHPQANMRVTFDSELKSMQDRYENEKSTYQKRLDEEIKAKLISQDRNKQLEDELKDLKASLNRHTQQGTQNYDLQREIETLAKSLQNVFQEKTSLENILRNTQLTVQNLELSLSATQSTDNDSIQRNFNERLITLQTQHQQEGERLQQEIRTQNELILQLKNKERTFESIHQKNIQLQQQHDELVNSLNQERSESQRKIQMLRGESLTDSDSLKSKLLVEQNRSLALEKAKQSLELELVELKMRLEQSSVAAPIANEIQSLENELIEMERKLHRETNEWANRYEKLKTESEAKDRTILDLNVQVKQSEDQILDNSKESTLTIEALNLRLTQLQSEIEQSGQEISRLEKHGVAAIGGPSSSEPMKRGGPPLIPSGDMKRGGPPPPPAAQAPALKSPAFKSAPPTTDLMDSIRKVDTKNLRKTEDLPQQQEKPVQEGLLSALASALISRRIDMNEDEKDGDQNEDWSD